MRATPLGFIILLNGEPMALQDCHDNWPYRPSTSNRSPVPIFKSRYQAERAIKHAIKCYATMSHWDDKRDKRSAWKIQRVEWAQPWP
jgi:hypothetical protein